MQFVKASNEGSGSPFIARVFFGLLSFRDQLYLLGIQEEDRTGAKRAFDASFKPLLEAAQASRDAAREVLRLVTTHFQSIGSGEAVRFHATHYEILESINSPLSQAFDKLIDQSIVATKGALQPFLRDMLQFDIGFFFQKDSQFTEGVTALRSKGEAILSSYLETNRLAWHADLQELRAKHEHEGWSLPGLQYSLAADNNVIVGIPLVLRLPVQEYARATANRTLRFIEDMVLYAMIRRCPYPLFLVEIPPEQRDPKDPARFRLAARGLDSSPPWEIYYSESADFV